MKVVVFGATGRVGQKLVTQLLEAGHEVRAFTHSSNKLPNYPKLEIVQGDVHNAADVREAIAGTDAVLCALGSWGTDSKDILVSAMQNIVPAMQAAGISRIISLTGSGTFDADDKPGVVDKISRFFISRLAAKVFNDGEQHIKLLRESKLDWTVIRSPAMLERGKPGQFKLNHSFPTPWATVMRDNVATAMVQQLNSKEWLKAAPFIHKK